MRLAASRINRGERMTAASLPLRIELGWPNKILSPNARGHHMGIWRAKKDARDEALWATRATIGRATFPHDGGDIILRQIAHPPDARHRDRDNLDHSLKSHRDGIADALGINDKHFRPTGIEWGEPIPGGKIIIEVGQ